MSIILYSPQIGPVSLDVILKEEHSSSLGITEIPIETGAKVTDHCYIEPKKLGLEFADANAALTYQALVRFQETRTPFAILSGLFRYSSMLVKDLKAERDQSTSQILKGTATIQEVILVSASVVGQIRNPQPDAADRAAPTINRGDQPTEPAPPNLSGLEQYFATEPPAQASSNPGGA